MSLVLRRERDSNPWSCYTQRFSRPPQSTTLPSLRLQKYKKKHYKQWFLIKNNRLIIKQVYVLLCFSSYNTQSIRQYFSISSIYITSMILSLQSAKNNKQQQQTNTYKYSQSVNTGLKI